MFFSSFSSATSEISRKQQWLLKIDIVPVPVYPPKAKPCDVSIPHEAWKICIPRPPTQAILVINPKPSLTPSQDLHATLSTRTVSGPPGRFDLPSQRFAGTVAHQKEFAVVVLDGSGCRPVFWKDLVKQRNIGDPCLLEQKKTQCRGMETHREKIHHRKNPQNPRFGPLVRSNDWEFWS